MIYISKGQGMNFQLANTLQLVNTYRKGRSGIYSRKKTLSEVKSLWVLFISECFILFDAIINRIVFLIFFLDSSLFMYRNTTDFFMLIFYPSTSTDLCVSSNSFSVCLFCGVLEIFCVKDHVIWEQIILLFIFQFGWFLSFFFLSFD